MLEIYPTFNKNIFCSFNIFSNNFLFSIENKNTNIPIKKQTRTKVMQYDH